ncbi:hypothetical protein [Streptomyces puniciscabiei]
MDRHAAEAGIDPDALDTAFPDGSALRDLQLAEDAIRHERGAAR